MPKFISINEFISATHISRPTINRQIKNHEIPCTRIGRRILIPTSFLDELENKALHSVKPREGA